MVHCVLRSELPSYFALTGRPLSGYTPPPLANRRHSCSAPVTPSWSGMTADEYATRGVRHSVRRLRTVAGGARYHSSGSADAHRIVPETRWHVLLGSQAHQWLPGD